VNFRIDVYYAGYCCRSVDPASVVLNVAGVPRTAADGSITVVDDTLIVFTPIAPDTFVDNQTVPVCLMEASDTCGDSLGGLPLCWQFFVDLTPPITTLISPPVGNLIASPTGFSFNLIDNGSGVDNPEVIVTVDGTPYPIDGTILTYASPLLIFDAIAAGLNWNVGDSILISVYAGDTPDYCDSNESTTSYAWYVRDPNPPITTIVSPNDGDFTACWPDSIVISIVDPNTVDPATIILSVNAVDYTVASTEIEWNEPLLIFRPTTYWANGTVVNVSLTHAADIFGNDITVPLTFSFTVDLNAPTAALDDPVNQSMTRDRAQDIALSVADPLSGVDNALIELTINSNVISTGDYTFSPDGSGGGSILFVPEYSDVEFVSGDTVFVSLEVCDSPDRCAPNCTTFAWWFIVEPDVECNVFPNPFTPNGDDANDIALFTYPHMLSENATIAIYDKRNIQVRKLEAPVQGGILTAVGRLWDGRDNDGQPLKPGLYLYVVTVNGEIICNGTVVLLR
jgi:hypothetical protein